MKADFVMGFDEINDRISQCKSRNAHLAANTMNNSGIMPDFYILMPAGYRAFSSRNDKAHDYSEQGVRGRPNHAEIFENMANCIGQD